MRHNTLSDESKKGKEIEKMERWPKWGMTLVMGMSLLVVGSHTAMAAEEDKNVVLPVQPGTSTLQGMDKELDSQYKEFYDRGWYDAADANHDGALSLNEANAAPKIGPEAGLDTVRFKHADANGDGIVSLDEAKGEKAFEIAHHERIDQFFQNPPNLAEDIAKYPNAAEYLAQHPKAAEFLKDRPELANKLAEHPAAAQKLANNPAAAQYLQDHPDVRQKLAQHPDAAKRLAEHPGAAKAIAEHPGVAKEVHEDRQWVKEHPKVPGEAREEKQYRASHPGVSSEVNRLQAGGAPTKQDATWAKDNPTARKEIGQHEQWKNQHPGAVQDMRQDRHAVRDYGRGEGRGGVGQGGEHRSPRAQGAARGGGGGHRGGGGRR